MRTSLIISGILHLILFVVIFLNFTTSRKLEVNQPQPLPVDIMTPAEFSEMKAGKKDGKETEALQPKAEEKKAEAAPKPIEKPEPSIKPSRQAATAPPPPASAPPPPEEKPVPPKPETPPEVKPEVEKKAETKPEPEKKPDAEAPKPEKKPDPPKPKKPVENKPKPKPKPDHRFDQDKIADLLNQRSQQTETKRDFNADRISALLNKDPNAGAPANFPERKEHWRPPSSLQDQAMGMSQATGTRMSASEIDIFRSQISRCWSPPIGGLGGDAIIVKLQFRLNRDGTLAGPPRVLNYQPSPFFQAAADATVRAVAQCAPYNLPPEKYDEWANNTFDFDPSQM